MCLILQILAYRRTYSMAGDDSKYVTFFVWNLTSTLTLKNLWSFQSFYVILNKIWQNCYIIAMASFLEFDIIYLDDQTGKGI